MNRPPSTFALREDSTYPHPNNGESARSGASHVSLGELDALLANATSSPAHRSSIIEMVVDEYCAMLGAHPTLTPAEYCRRFSSLPSSLRSSIYRQLEVEHFVETHALLKDQRNEYCWPLCGDRYGSLIVQEELGRGSLARVYLCRQAEVGDRQVVMKTGFMTKNEAYTLGRLQHESIVPILSLERHPQTNTIIICMPFLGRSTLYDLIDAAFESNVPVSGDIVDKVARIWVRDSDDFAPITNRGNIAPSAYYINRVVAISMRLTNALQHAHERGIIHGDIKPSNIILTPNGEPLLTDFNLSGNTALSIEPRGGTIPYMAPEQLLSHAGRSAEDEKHGARADLFSLGVLMYELLTGQLPFEVGRDAPANCETINELLCRQQKGCVAVRSRNARVPRSLAAVVERCLSWNPNDRYSSALDLSIALKREHRFLNGALGLLCRHKRVVVPAVAMATVFVITAIALRAARPPLHERLYVDALHSIQTGDITSARIALLASLDAMPSHVDARLELGKLELRRGEMSAAMDSFFIVATDHSDPRGDAYLGYAFGLKGQFTQAIPWLESAARLGLASAETMNNLAVAYELGDSAMHEVEQLDAARDQLKGALELLPKSTTVRYNWIRHELLRRELGIAPITKHTVDVAYKLANDLPDCAEINECAARVAVMACTTTPDCGERAIAFLSAAAANGGNVNANALNTDPRWEPIRELPQFGTLLQSLRGKRGPSRNSTKVPRLLEPSPLAL